MSQNKSGVDIQQDEILQAVIVAHSFNSRFAPLSQLAPRCLMPIGNVPLLHYNLYALWKAKFHHVYIYASKKSDDIEKAVQAWKNEYLKSEKMLVTVFTDKLLTSVGDVVRDVDRRAIIKSDFLLLTGDLVVNADMAALISKHRERRAVDKGCLLSMIMSSSKELRKHDPEQLMLLCRGDDDRLLAYSRCGSREMASVQLSCEMLMQKDVTPTSTYFDLVDTQICVCSEHLPPLFSDEFDHQSIVDSVKGILINEDILGNSVYIHKLDGDYAARARNPQAYRAINKNVLQQRLAPLSIPKISSMEKNDYHCRATDMLVSDTAQVGSGRADTHRSSVIGRGSKIAADVEIDSTSIGNNCIIGKNCKLFECIIWNEVSVEENVTAKGAIFAPGVVVKSGCKIQDGVLLMKDVVVGPNITVPVNTVVVVTGKEKPDIASLGTSTNAVFWKPPSASKIGEDDFVIWGKKDRASLHNNAGSDDDDDSDDDSDTGSQDIHLELHDDMGMEARFSDEVNDIIDVAIEENTEPELVLLEVNSVKHAYNVTIERVHYLLSRAAFEYPIRNKTPSASVYLTEAQLVLKRLHPVFLKYFVEPGSSLAWIRALEDIALSHAVILRVALNLIKWSYDEDLVEEEDVLAWFAEPIPAEGNQVRLAVQPFVTWLKEADEAESD